MSLALSDLSNLTAQLQSLQIRSKTLLVLFDFWMGALEEPRKLAGGKAALRRSHRETE